MRPIHLTIAGLHSFRERQEIDFRTLCENGVFGIFGPTGSGKSSLLDAMTLALYGKVERASNNTQGIMNHAEDEISVSFTFELGQAQGTERYKIERSYKRAWDISIRTSVCRLLQLHVDTNETIVLADKANEVQEKLHELIGLTIDDFTRAVVLPQGKFAEFLSLKGVERRQMLQRLFHLEQYGDQLNEKIKHRIAKLRNRLNEIVAEQQGLGEASQEALQALEQKVQEISEQIQLLTKERLSFEQQYEQVKQRRDWQSQLERVKQNLEQVLEKQQEMEALQQRLTLAEEAQQQKPYVDEYLQAQNEKDSWTAKLSESKTNRETAIKINAESEKEFLHRKEEKERKQPALIERKHALKQASQMQLEAHAKETEIHQLVEALQEDQQQLQQTKEELGKQTELLERAKEKQQQLKGELAGKSLTIEYKQKLQKAYQSYVLYEQQKKHFTQLDQEAKQHQNMFVKIKKSLSEVDREKQQITNQALDMLKHFNLLTYRVERYVKDVEQELEEKQHSIAEQQQKIEAAMEAEWVNRLVQGLHNGEPCPVCGAIEHPQPAEHEHVDVHFYRQDIEQQTRWTEKAKQVVQECRFRLHQLTEARAQLVEWVQSELDQIDQEKMNEFISSEAIEQLAVTENQSSDEERETLIDFYQEQITAVQDVLDAHKTFMQRTKASLQQWHDSSYQLKTANENMKSSEKKRDEAEEKLTQFKKGWSEQFPEWTLDEIAEKYELMHQQEQEVSELQTRVDKSIPFIEEQEALIKKLDTKAVQTQMKWTERTSILKQLENQLKELNQKITEQVGQQSIEESLQETESQLEQLIKGEQQSYESWQTARHSLAQAEQAYAIAEESLRQAHQRWEKAEKKMLQLLQDSRFTTWQDIQDAYISKEEQAEWKAVLETYKESKKSLLREKENLQAKLGEYNVSNEEWEKWTQRKQELEQNYHLLIEARGATQKEWTSMQAKHERYMVLDQEKDKTEKELEQYGLLQAVFRGNSFVEYIAEEQLVQVCRDASSRLGQLTRQRYALEVDSQGGFVIRDDANGGVRRPVSTLSGGETFLTSLSLALALSAQIQLRGQYPLEFFFLDEGFGTLDPELLDNVVTALENLHLQRLAVGVISHVPELRERLPRKLIVTPAEPSGRGSRVHVETL